MGDLSAIRVLLSQGMSINASDYEGRTALMLAAHGNQEVGRPALSKVGQPAA